MRGLEATPPALPPVAAQAQKGARGVCGGVWVCGWMCTGAADWRKVVCVCARMCMRMLMHARGVPVVHGAEAATHHSRTAQATCWRGRGAAGRGVAGSEVVGGAVVGGGVVGSGGVVGGGVAGVDEG